MSNDDQLYTALLQAEARFIKHCQRPSFSLPWYARKAHAEIGSRLYEELQEAIQAFSF